MAALSSRRVSERTTSPAAAPSTATYTTVAAPVQVVRRRPAQLTGESHALRQQLLLIPRQDPLPLYGSGHPLAGDHLKVLRRREGRLRRLPVGADHRLPQGVLGELLRRGTEGVERLLGYAGRKDSTAATCGLP